MEEMYNDDDVVTLPETAVAIDGDKSSQHAAKWAVEHLASADEVIALLHVKTSNAYAGLLQCDDAAAGGKRTTMDQELAAFFRPFRLLFARKGVKMVNVVVENTDVAFAIDQYIMENQIRNIVVGAANKNAIARRFMGRQADVPSTLMKIAPDFCSVYVIWKDKALRVRPASRAPMSGAAFPAIITPSRNRSLYGTDQYEWTTAPSWPWRHHQYHRISAPTAMQVHHAHSYHVQAPTRPWCSHSSSEDLDLLESRSGSSFRSSDLSDSFDSPSLSNRSSMSSSNSSSQMLDSNSRDVEEVEMNRMQKFRYKTAIETIHEAQNKAEQELQQLKWTNAEIEAKERKNKSTERSLAFNDIIKYRNYRIEEIEAATNEFSIDSKIGEGGYGSVYKCHLDHTLVAVKVLRPDANQGRKQFHQEVEVLNCIRHPNMVLLLGACPEYGCLVYEYMENGSLDDRLFCRNGTPPIPWQLRFKIAVDIATGLLFLHQAQPEPLVHRDLKPGNILLDRNYVAKISDVGLARLVPPKVADTTTQYLMTATAGTFCYIDPEYQMTGTVGIKSDVYSFGILLLQLITGKPPMGLAHIVENAIEEGTFEAVLDPTVKDWPVEEAMALGKLALSCAEMRRKEKPDLGAVVLPELGRLERKLQKFGKNIIVCI